MPVKYSSVEDLVVDQDYVQHWYGVWEEELKQTINELNNAKFYDDDEEITMFLVGQIAMRSALVTLANPEYVKDFLQKALVNPDSFLEKEVVERITEDLEDVEN